MGDTSESAYILDRSQDESKRLNDQQKFFTNLLNNDLVNPSIPRDSLNTIADVATGTGLWLTSLPGYLGSVDNHPVSRTLHGFDISADQFPSMDKTAPGHEVQFLVHDARNRFPEPYRGKYDLVNVTFLVVALRAEEYEPVVRNLLEILKPNGYLQWTEANPSILGTIQLPSLEIKTIPNLIEVLKEGMSRVGFSHDPPSRIQHLAQQLGFAQVENHSYSITERADLRGQAREWLETAWRTLIPHALVQSGQLRSTHEAEETVEKWTDEIKRECGEFWPLAEVRVVVARKEG